MLDYLHIPDNPNGTIDYFPGFSDINGGSWVAWEKPRAAHMIRITCIGGGGGGGSGWVTAPGGGGGGGGSSAISIVTIPAYVLPDRLYISSGMGGINTVYPTPSSSPFGVDGVSSYVCIAPDIGTIYRVCYADSGKGGAGAGNTIGGLAGAGGIISTLASMPLAFHGIRDFIAGQSGGNGGSFNSTNVRSYPSTGLLLSGAPGGTGSDNSASSTITTQNQTAYTLLPNLGVQVPATPSYPGREIYQPLMSCGGSGSPPSFNMQGGTGGFGSGGAGAAGGISQIGGHGGDGLVIIHTW